MSEGLADIARDVFENGDWHLIEDADPHVAVNKRSAKTPQPPALSNEVS